MKRNGQSEVKYEQHFRIIVNLAHYIEQPVALRGPAGYRYYGKRGYSPVVVVLRSFI
jgi:hypothetical protein